MLIFIKNYFSDKFTPLIRYLHYLVLLLVLYEILISSNLIKISDDGIISNNIIEYYGTWSHITVGLLLFLLAIIFIVVELSKHGFKYFYPYLYGEMSQLKSDINQIKSLEIPEPVPQGLAAIIQGLGIGALLIVTLSGATWFLLWLYDSSVANDIKDLHGLLTGFIEAYVIAHGGMGLLHIFIAYRGKKTAYK